MRAIEKILTGIHVISGAETHRILDVIADFTGQSRPEIFLYFRDGQPIQLDDIRLTPIRVEHSAKDAYMFLVQADGESVLYTGDFRTSEKALSAVRKHMDERDRLSLLITEGTNICRGKQERIGELQGEEWVKRQTAEWMQQYEGTVFVLCSSANDESQKRDSKIRACTDCCLFHLKN